MTKQEIRKEYIKKRNALSDKQLLINQDLILIQFQRLVIPEFQLIHTYLPIQNNNEPARAFAFRRRQPQAQLDHCACHNSAWRKMAGCPPW